jgi:hypothetical protein
MNDHIPYFLRPVRGLLKFRDDLSRLRDQMQRVNEYANAARLVEWINDPKRKPANTEFTEGPERQVACAIEQLLVKSGAIY